MESKGEVFESKRPQILIGSIDADYYLLVIRILESEGYQVILRSGGRGDRPSRRRERCQSHPLSIGRRVGSCNLCKAHMRISPSRSIMVS